MRASGCRVADASKLRGLKRSGLGAPPAQDEARTDLNPMAHEPAASSEAAPPESISRQPEPEKASSRLDGRSMRRSGRTVQFATRVSPDFDHRVRRIAIRDRLLLVEVLERALDAYERSRK